MDRPISIAIETSGATGGVALGGGDALRRAVAFPAHARHATQLICRLDELLAAESLGPHDLDEVYVSAGPGSFTGLRIGITAARTLAQAVAGLRCVAVPTAAAVAENLRDRTWQHLAVVVNIEAGRVYATCFRREDDRIAQIGEPHVAPLSQVLSSAPRPLLLAGAELRPEEAAEEGLSLAAGSLATPTAEGAWRAGRELAHEGRFTDAERLLPIYARRPEAVRLWNQRHGDGGRQV